MDYKLLFYSILIAFGVMVIALVMLTLIHVVLGGIPIIVKVIGLFVILVCIIYSRYKGE